MTAKHVLIIDDDADMRILLSALLEHLGAQPHAVADATALDEAMKATAGQAFDLILLDLVMPDDGFRSCVAVLQAHACHTPISLLSGSSAETLDAKLRELRASGLNARSAWAKPVRIDLLATALAEPDHPIDP